MDRGGHHITRALFEQNMDAKLRDPQFTADIGPLLAPGFAWDIDAAATAVSERLIQALPANRGTVEDNESPVHRRLQTARRQQAAGRRKQGRISRPQEP
jgi:hypothetical protein